MGADDLLRSRQQQQLRRAAPGTLGGRVKSPGRLQVRRPQLEKSGASPSSGAGATIWVPAARASDGVSVEALVAGWNIIEFTARDEGFVWRTEAHTDVDRAFSLVLLTHGSGTDDAVVVGDLPADPFVAGAWDTLPAGWLNHWGQYNDERAAREAAGYSTAWGKGFETDGDSLTGDLYDDAGWVYTHDLSPGTSPSLFAAIYVTVGATDFWMKLTRGPS